MNKMERVEKIPHGRYVNFVAEFLAANKGKSRAEAIAAWTELKQLDAAIRSEVHGETGGAHLCAHEPKIFVRCGLLSLRSGAR